MRNRHRFSLKRLLMALTVTVMIGQGFGDVLRQGTDHEKLVTEVHAESPSDVNVDIALRSQNHIKTSPGDFPVCTTMDGPFPPFCLPQDGEDVIVDATYYVTWNADLYPLNSTVTIELRYVNSSDGDSAFTSEKTDNSYGYIPLHTRRAWLQGKAENALTLYIIELDSASGQRASARRGPTIMLRPRPVEHYPPPPPLSFNRQALLIGLPVSLAVVVLIVVGLFFGMRERRRIGLGNIMGSRGKGYGIGKSKDERLNYSKGPGGLAASLGKDSDDIDDGLSEVTDPEVYHNDLERTASYVFRKHVSKLKSWS